MFVTIFIIVFGLVTFSWLHILNWIFALIVLIVLVYGVYYLLVTMRHHESFSALPRLKELVAMDPIVFKHTIFDLFKEHGYVGKLAMPSSDNVVDMWMHKDGIQYAIQVQHRSPRMSIREKHVRNFYEYILHFKNTVGIIVTTSDFTKVVYYWDRPRAHRLQLIPGRKLVRIMSGFESL